MSARLRGRWTPEQQNFIKQMAKAERATAGETIRHSLAWYLKQDEQLPVVRNLAPSADRLVKRETRFKVMDFLTTPDHAAAIKTTAGGGGEAALMRQAVDAFKARGPWSKG